MTGRILRLGSASLLSLVLLTGCESSPDEAPKVEASTIQPQNLETYNVSGRIRSITPDRDFMMVQHDSIEGFMDAMTMPFAVSDTSLILGVAEGDSIHFEVQVSGYDLVVTDLSVVE